MANYMPVLVWVICAMICYYIAKARNVKPSLFWTLIVVFLGPLAMPLLLLAKSQPRM
jgi:hypothetical protein